MAILFDLSHLKSWPGNLTGVPRVEYELAIRFASVDGINFVEWSSGDFRPVDGRGWLELKRSTTEKESAPHTAKKSPVLKRYAARVPLAKRAHKVYVHGRTKLAEVPKYDFVSTDVLFIPQGIWNDQAYIQKIVDLRAKGVKIVQIAYDMLPIVAPQYSGHSTDWLLDYATKTFPISNLILSISEHTSKDLREWLTKNGLPVPKIKEFMLGEDYAVAEPKKPNDAPKPQTYILCVGTIEARKNHMLLYYAYKQAKSKGIQLPKLVIVGRRGWHTENVYDLLTKDTDVKQDIQVLESATDNELAWLYKNCAFSVYPSFYEGWGLPIAESLHYGAPCICSNTSSMPEVAGDLVDYFDPTSPDEFLQKVTALLEPEKLSNARKRAVQYKSRSWDSTFTQVKKDIMNI